MSLAKPISVISYEVDAGGITAGSRSGPSVLLRQGLISRLEALGYEASQGLMVKQEGAGEGKPANSEREIRNISTLLSCCEKLGESVKEEFGLGKTPLILGGDHSVSIGSVSGLSAALGKEPLGLIWIDTHPDLNTPQTSPSKSLFGMSVAALIGAFEGKLSKLVNTLGEGFKKRAINPEHLIYIGLRDIDSGEKDLLRSLGIKTYTMRDIDIEGMFRVISAATSYLRDKTAGFTVSFDLDVCDPRLVPGTGTPYRGGLSFREAHLLAEIVYESKSMLALEMVELNPILDKDFQTTRLALSLIESFFGDTI